jgi:predicted AlkP superfamily phosphohydrolase/phosphomutase
VAVKYDRSGGRLDGPKGLLSANTGDGAGKLADVDWSRTQIYAIGLNSLYLNLQSREGKGAVKLKNKEQVLYYVRELLLHWEGPNTSHVVQRVLKREEAFEGALSEHSPDLVVGYSPSFG